jgi:signal transduction histidine kinase
MQNAGESNKATHEIGRIYDALTDSKVLIEFFLQTVLQFISAERGYLFLAGAGKKIWLEGSTFLPKEASASLTEEVRKVFEEGKPFSRGKMLFLPLIARNSSMGVACLERAEKDQDFTEKEVETGFDLASEFSGALKNILLFEENLKMERLAAVGQAMGMVIHEIKNIMQLARFSDELVRMGVKEKNDEFLNTGFDMATKTLKELDGFIWEMLSLTKDYQLEPEDVNVPALLAELKGDLKQKADGYKIALDFQAEKDFPVVQGDGRSIYRALLNLIKNAFEAFGEKPDACIKVCARVLDKEKYEVTVEDNASGMTEEVRARLFEAFFSTKGKRGTGLGLMVVARTAKMHQGTVRVESKLGVGTKFILTLPRAFAALK